MGITALWNVIKDQDRSVPIAQLAEDHFKKHGLPLQIAVDKADWRFNNLTAQQVYMIRETSNEPAFQGIEKSVFYRICRLLTLNVQLLFVFDGPSKPGKRGRRGGNLVDYEQRRLLKELLNCFRIPHHEAPGEAEAECARLQQLGVVDAVFSQDSDTLMFGCSLLLRDDRVAKDKGNSDRSKENTLEKSGTSGRVVYGRDIQARHNLDREGLVLFTMLCGGDYDTLGLRGCGAAMALGVVRAGLGTTLSRDLFEPDLIVKVEIPTYLLQRALPQDVLDPPPPLKKTPCKRKKQAEDDDSTTGMTTTEGPRRSRPTPLSQRTVSDISIPSSLYLGSTKGTPSLALDSTSAQRPGSIPPASRTAEVIILSDSDDDAPLPLGRRSSTIDLGDSPLKTDEEEELNRAIQSACRTPVRHEHSERKELEAYAKSVSLQSPHQMDTRVAVAATASGLTSNPTTTLSRVTNTSLSEIDIRNISTSGMSLVAQSTERSQDSSSAADVRAARLRFFTSYINESKATSEPSPKPTQATASPPKGRPVTTQWALEDVETIDRT
ncbi:PIN domain-like protein [Bimuria novae-zelandiae CBS 107.79]|uniref:PIN domain-like protein n=1 Tax=Bimuria novae-zelandiae CBS 107.79 TaxID=1447943 RepID=A0A6A5V0R1_9PLEO|nr:PIN domain-like protein [Bimuria novae-zelandiae CBS 107.79]